MNDYNPHKSGSGIPWSDRTELEKYARVLTKMAADPTFIAYWVGRWCVIYNRRLADAANEMCTTEDIAVHIMMCGAPRHGQDIYVIADKFSVRPVALASIVYLCVPFLDALPVHPKCSS